MGVTTNSRSENLTRGAGLVADDIFLGGGKYLYYVKEGGKAHENIMTYCTRKLSVHIPVCRALVESYGFS